MNFKVPLLFFLLSLLIGKLIAQDSDGKYLFKTLEEDRGLSNSNVVSILKDSRGFMWFGTANGLNRFDGTRMKSYYSEERDTASLTNNYISGIYEGPEENLWIKNSLGLFNVFIADKEIFERKTSRLSTKYGLLSENVKMVMKDHEGKFWFAHQEKGISIYDPQTFQSRYLIPDSTNPGALGEKNISSIAQSPKGDFWIVYQNGIVESLNQTDWKVNGKYKIERYLDATVLYDFEIFVDSDGLVWIFCPNQNFGLINIDPEKGQINYIDQNSSPLKLNNNIVNGLIEHRKGELWVGTDHGGINVIDKESTAVKYVMNDPEISRSLSDNAVYSLYKDTEGIVWIGTFKKGINYYHQGLMQFAHIRRGFGAEGSLPYNDVNVFAEDSLGNLYLGTNGQGLFYHDRKAGTYTHYLHNPNEINSLAGDVIVDLKLDREGILWIGTYLNGLSRFDGKDFRNYSHDPADPTSIQDPNVWKIHLDQKNRLWIGTLRRGLHLFDRENDAFIHYPVMGERLQLNNKYVCAFAEDDHGNLWIGGGYGIDLINLETGFHRYFSGKTGSVSGLSGNGIIDIFKDSKGVIWVTTSQGLNYFDEKHDRFVSFSSKDGLPSDYIVSILEDENHNFWLSTHNGLSYARVDRGGEKFEISFMNFDERDGLQAALFNQNSSLKTSAGEFIFGGPNGYNLFKSENFPFALNEFKVFFTEFQLFNKVVKIGELVDGRVLLETSLDKIQEVHLKHNENIFSLEFSALNFIQSEKNKFRYKLEGFNEDWITLSEPPFRVTYTNLDPGMYRLLVQPTNNDGLWSEKENAFVIHIKAPFWKTSFAYFLYFVLLVLTGVFARKQILEKEREKFRRVEELREAKRIQELDKMKTMFFTNVSHEFRTPLTLILAPVEKLLQNSKSQSDTYQFLTLKRNAKRLLQLVNKLLDVKNLENEGIYFNPASGDLIPFIEDRVHAFAELSEKQQIQLSFESTISTFSTQFDDDKLEKIIFNLLSNAFKFTPHDGHIEVKVNMKGIEDNEGVITITFRDSGVGIPEEDFPKIFDRYFTSDQIEHGLNQGSGIGLSIAQEFTKMHKGEITATSILGQGSEFVVRLRLPILEEMRASGDSWVENDILLQGSEEGSPPTQKAILLVEDNDDFRFYLQDCLKDEYLILMAADGNEGLEKALWFMPDLVVSDLMMPHLSGVELCQKLRKDIKTSHIPVIILTAKGSDEKHLEGLDSGCNLFISKPFNLEILQSSIRNLLREREILQNHYRKKISANTSEHEIESLDDQLIQKAIKSVEAQIENPDFSVEQMSKELGMSRVHLYKKLSSLTGKSPLEFIRMIRLQRAVQLLAKSQLTVSEIAYKVGYNNAKYFTKHFKAEYGILPSLYGQKKQKEVD